MRPNLELLAFVGSGRRVTQAVRLAPGDVVALARALDAGASPRSGRSARLTISARGRRTNRDSRRRCAHVGLAEVLALSWPSGGSATVRSLRAGARVEWLGGVAVRVTAVPAEDGPNGMQSPGPVIGFRARWAGLDTVYRSRGCGEVTLVTRSSEHRRQQRSPRRVTPTFPSVTMT
jgi:hypothetical protein